MSGYAWSNMPDSSDEKMVGGTNTKSGQGIGWISFSCANSSSCGTADYGVTVDTATGLMSGDAWSEYAGWVSFDTSDVSGCPTPESGGRCQAKVDLDPASPTAGKVTGWARALAAPAAGSNAGGWDGWIHLSGSNYGVTKDMTPADGCSWSGYAWGGPVLGWIEFNPSIGGTSYGVRGGKAGCNSVNASITADRTSGVNAGDTIHLSWTSSNAVSCTGSNFSTGGAVSGSNVPVTVPATTIYGVNCTGPGGSDTANVLVTVNVSSSALSLIPDSSSIQSGKKINLNWNGTNVVADKCKITSSAGLNTGFLTGTSGTVPNITINNPTTFTLTCTSSVAPGNSVSTTAVVGVIPTIIEPQ